MPSGRPKKQKVAEKIPAEKSAASIMPPVHQRELNQLDVTPPKVTKDMTDLPPLDEPKKAPQISTPAPQKETCPACGNEFDGTPRYCPHCGAGELSYV